MKKLALAVALLGLVGCSNVEHTPAQAAGYDQKYDYAVEHMPDLDRQIYIRDKLQASVCDGEAVKTFNMNRKWGLIKCVNGAYMRFSIDQTLTL